MKIYNFNLSDDYTEKHIDLFIKELTDYYLGTKDNCGEDDELTIEAKELLISVLNKPTLDCKKDMSEYLILCHEAVNGRIEECYKGSKDLLEMFKDLAYLEYTA